MCQSSAYMLQSDFFFAFFFASLKLLLFVYKIVSVIAFSFQQAIPQQLSLCCWWCSSSRISVIKKIRVWVLFFFALMEKSITKKNKQQQMLFAFICSMNSKQKYTTFFFAWKSYTERTPSRACTVSSRSFERAYLGLWNCFASPSKKKRCILKIPC